MNERKILFRVWDGERMCSPEEAEGLFFLTPSGEVWWDASGHGDIGVAEECVAFEDTGLKDIEGTPIFEGDVLEWKTRKPVGTDAGNLPIYEDETAREYVHFENGAYRAANMPVARINSKARVVGNVHANPELLND